MSNYMPATTEWKPVTGANFYEWSEQLFEQRAYNSKGQYYEDPVVHTVLMRIPGKWERRVRCWAAESKPGHMVSSRGEPAMQVEAHDGCPLDRGPVVYLSDIAYYSSDFDESELSGLEWRDLSDKPA